MRQVRQMVEVIRFTVVGVCLSALVTLGCSSGPTRVLPPKIDAEDAGAAAIEQYDTDGDGAISGAELDAVPGIKVAETLPKYDKDGDGNVTADEIAARIIEWQDSKVGISQAFLCSVYLDGRPLPGATVELVPEAFLGPAVKGAIGISNDQGVVNAGIRPEDRAADLKNVNGMQLGLFKVVITHPDIQIPARYNTATTLGEEYAHDRRIMSSDDIRFMIRSQ